MESLIALQAELKVPKGQLNKFGNYKYRSCEDIIEAVKPLLNKYKCVMTLSDDLVILGNRVFLKATAEFIAPDGKIKTATGYAEHAPEKKGMDVAQITGSASSYARKYALCGLLLIDDESDADAQDASKAPPSPPMPGMSPPAQIPLPQSPQTRGAPPPPPPPR